MQTWKVDPMHSEVQFKVRHLMISTVTGSFTDFDGTITSQSDDFTDAQANFALKTASISTNQSQRDEHLKSAEFFDAEQFPEITFVSEAISKAGDAYTISGNLTIKNETKAVSLTGTFGGTMVDFYGQTKAGFELTGHINRQDFGLTWSGVTEAGGVVVSDEVKLLFSIQLTLQA